MDKSCASTRWYALHVRSRHEKSVAAQLEAKSCLTFLPLYASRRRWQDRWKTVEWPLFPGYIFCQFDSSRCSHVLATSGVIDVVRFGGSPKPIEDPEIDAIKIVVGSRLDIEPYPSLVPGETVMIERGPLAGVTGTLVKQKKDYRLVVSVELLNRSVLVQVEPEWARPLTTNREKA